MSTRITFRFSVFLGAFAFWPVSQTSASDPLQTGGSAAWIWSSAYPLAAIHAPADTVAFTRTFEIPADAEVTTAELLISVDNEARIFLNGAPAGKTHSWNPMRRLDVTRLVEPGKNTLLIEASNGLPSPAGLLVELTVTLAGHPAVRIVTDDGWDTAIIAKDRQGEVLPSVVIAQNGDSPWGLCLPPGGNSVFPEFSADGADMRVFQEMLRRFHAACKIEATGTYALAWLPRAMLWVGDSVPVADSRNRARVAHRIATMRISPEGYVSGHHRDGLGHSEGWPFPFPEQSGGFSFYFTTSGLPWGANFGIHPVDTIDGWELEGVRTVSHDLATGWLVDLEPDAAIVSPVFDVDAFVTPFIRVKWDAAGLPEGIEPFIEWATEIEPEFSSARRMSFPAKSSSSRGTIQDFDIPVHQLTGATGRITRLRLAFGNPTAGRVNLLRIFSAVDSRHPINNPNYLIAATDYFNWTGDTAWLLYNLPKMRLALRYMIDEFAVRETGVIRRPWVGHDGRSGLEITPEGEKIIHPGVGIGGNYWDLMPFGGDDVIASTYLYAALVQMADVEAYLAQAPDLRVDAAAPGHGPSDLRELATKVREQFQVTFWNSETGRFAPIDDQREFRDFGYTFVNNEAIFYGLASDEQAREILAWLDGNRIVEIDTSVGEDIYRWRFGPRASTRRNLDYYQYVWFAPENLEFGDQVQDGGAVLGFAYHDLMARIHHIGPDSAWSRIIEMFEWYEDIEAAGGARAYYAEPGRGTLQGGGTPGGLGIDEEFYESVLVPAIVLDGFLGFSVRPDGFDVNPRLPDEVGAFGITHIAYRDLLLHVEFSQDSITFDVESGEVDRLLRVGLPAGAWEVTFLRGPADPPVTFSASETFSIEPGPLTRLILRR